MFKKAELEYLTEYIKPDILLITETKIDKTISSSEFLPANFSYNIRKDRTSDGDDVVIAAWNDLDILDVELGEKQAEIVSAKVLLKGHAPIIICSFYRTPSKHGDDSVEQVEELETALNNIRDNHDTDKCTLIIGGDFNAPNINWEDHIIPNGVPNRGMNEKLLDILDKKLFTSNATPTY